MPFASYKDFQDCVNKNQDKTNPEAFCSWLHHKVTGKYPTEKNNAVLFLQKTDKEFIIYGKASVETIDSHGDIITSNALSGAVEGLLKSGLLSIDHTDFRAGEIIPEYTTETGETYKTEVKGDTLWVVAKISTDTEIGRQIKKDIEDNKISGFSITGVGMNPKNNEYGGKTIDNIEIYAVTLCRATEPANPEANEITIIQKQNKMKNEVKKQDEIVEEPKPETITIETLIDLLKKIDERVANLEAKQVKAEEKSKEKEEVKECEEKEVKTSMTEEKIKAIVKSELLTFSNANTPSPETIVKSEGVVDNSKIENIVEFVKKLDWKSI